MTSVIVFGPTGQIGTFAARTAAEQGVKVWLAMRTPSKPIPGLDESTGTFERIQADLQDAESVKAAVAKSGARRAFIYLAHGSSDHMRATIEALKAGGAKFVVFVSSFTIYTDRPLRDIQPADYIPYVHAQVEANLDDVFGDDNYVALRPGAFASNLMQYKDGINKGEIAMYSGKFIMDNINPSDIGRVAGHVLVNGSKNGQKKVYVYGPEQVSVSDSLPRVAKVLGKDIQFKSQSREEAIKIRTDEGMPEFIATYLVDTMAGEGPDKGDNERFPNYDEGVNNVKLYTGQPGSTLEEWAEENSSKF